MCLNSSWDPVKHQCEPLDRLGYVLNICQSLPLHGIGFATGLSPLSILRLHSPRPQDHFPTAWHSYLNPHSIFVSFCCHVLPACNSAHRLTHPQATYSMPHHQVFPPPIWPSPQFQSFVLVHSYQTFPTPSFLKLAIL